MAALTGCEPVPDDGNEERNQLVVTQLEDQLASSGDYTRVEVTYADNASAKQSLGIDVNCRACDPAQSADDALRSAWRSDVSPLTSALVRVTNTQTNQQTTLRVILPEDEAEMVEKYGERP